jgi:hypothetical protein
MHLLVIPSESLSHDRGFPQRFFGCDTRGGRPFKNISKKWKIVLPPCEIFLSPIPVRLI